MLLLKPTASTNMSIFWILFLTTFAVVYSAKFHENLQDDDLLHYFGTNKIEHIPQYAILDESTIISSVQRSHSNRVLDVDVFGKRYNFPLHLNSKLVGAACYIHYMVNDVPVESSACGEKYSNCHYIVRTSDYKAAFSTCNGTGLYGVLSAEEYDLVVQPIMKNHISMVVNIKGPINVDDFLSNNSRPHLIVRKENVKGSRSFTRNTPRMTRNAIERQLDILVATDENIAHYFLKAGTIPDLIAYTLAISNIVAALFQDETLSDRLVLTVGPVFLFGGPTQLFKTTPDAQETLNDFCSWQKDVSLTDVSILVSREDFITDPTLDNYDLVGLAYKPGICQADRRCAIAEYYGLETAFTVAHEIGHTLNMSHDNLYPECNNTGNIMQAHGSEGSASFHWSTCSNAAMTKYLHSSRKTDCLGAVIVTPQSAHLPGEMYNREDQCLLAFGTQYTPDDVSENKCILDCCLNNNCKEINSMDGTECGWRKWCIKGICQDIGPSGPLPVDGGWSLWGDWSECSRTVGGGVHERHRMCNNPRPRYSGSACIGESKDIRLCNVQPFAASDWYFKKQQQESYTHESVRLYGCFMALANSTTNEGRNFIDGTNCVDTYGNVDQITKCYKGQCESFGCDGHYGSPPLRFDQCGVCNGDGNCFKYENTVPVNTLLKSSVDIPSGVTGVKVVNYCPRRVKLVLKQTGMEDRFDFNHVTQLTNETIRILGPLRHGIHIEVVKIREFRFIGCHKEIEYEFWIPAVPVRPVYTWSHGKPTDCSATCGKGVMVTRPVCVDEHKNMVEDAKCDIRTMPSEITEPCGTPVDCYASWKVGEYSSCSRSCGSGESRRYIRCYQIIDGITTILPKSQCKHLQEPISTKICNPQLCPPEWEAGPWTACSATCGIGVGTRTVECVNAASSPLAYNDSFCPADQRPIEQEVCCTRPCYVADKNSGCIDKKICSLYSELDCTKQKLRDWMAENCPHKCGLCGCRDLNKFCEEYKKIYCLFRWWSRQFCGKTCGRCLSQGSSTCEQLGPE